MVRGRVRCMETSAYTASTERSNSDWVRDLSRVPGWARFGVALDSRAYSSHPTRLPHGFLALQAARLEDPVPVRHEPALQALAQGVAPQIALEYRVHRGKRPCEGDE